MNRFLGRLGIVSVAVLAAVSATPASASPATSQTSTTSVRTTISPAAKTAAAAQTAAAVSTTKAATPIVTRRTTDSFSATVLVTDSLGTQQINIDNDQVTLGQVLGSRDLDPTLLHTTGGSPVAASQKVKNGQTLLLFGSEITTTSGTVKLPRPSVTQRTNSLYVGQTKVGTAGRDGQAIRTIVNTKALSGKNAAAQKAARTPTTTEENLTVLIQPQPRVTLVGTKPRPVAAVAPSTDDSASGSSRSSSSRPSSISQSSDRTSETASGSSPVVRASSSNPVSGGTSCVASTYGEGDGTAGGPTASGETFDPSRLTAASRTLPLGTTIRVTNVSNGQTVSVRINDRGPYIGGRCLDLSTAAMNAIAPGEGLITVRYE